MCNCEFLNSGKVKNANFQVLNVRILFRITAFGNLHKSLSNVSLFLKLKDTFVPKIKTKYISTEKKDQSTSVPENKTL